MTKEYRMPMEPVYIMTKADLHREYDRIWKAAHAEGYLKGHDEGYHEGCDEGYSAGLVDGKTDAFRTEQDDGRLDSPLYRLIRDKYNYRLLPTKGQHDDQP